jgi:hypothetical protein
MAGHRCYGMDTDFTVSGAGICNADVISALRATVQAGTATSWLPGLLFPSTHRNPPNPPVPTCPTQYLSSRHCLRQGRATSRDETREDLWLAVHPRLARRLLQSTPKLNSSTPAALIHTPKQTVGYQIPTCRSSLPIDMLHALLPFCPFALPSALVCLQEQLHACILQSRNLHPLQNSHTPHSFRPFSPRKKQKCTAKIQGTSPVTHFS